MSYVIKDGNGATATVQAATLSGNILPQVTLIDTTGSGTPLTGPAGTPAAPVLTVQGNATGTPVPAQANGLAASSPPALGAGQAQLSLNLTGGLRVEQQAAGAATPISSADGVAGTNMPESSVGLLNAGGTFDRMRAAAGAPGVQAINTEGTKASYTITIQSAVPAAACTDLITLQGSNTKTIRINRVFLTGNGNAGTLSFRFQTRSTANTGGTSSTQGYAPNDSNDAAGTAVVTIYTANPTSLGTNINTVGADRFAVVPGTTATQDRVDKVWGTRNSKAIVLRGNTQYFAINLNASTIPAATNLDITIEWTEE